MYVAVCECIILQLLLGKINAIGLFLQKLNFIFFNLKVFFKACKMATITVEMLVLSKPEEWDYLWNVLHALL